MGCDTYCHQAGRFSTKRMRRFALIVAFAALAQSFTAPALRPTPMARSSAAVTPLKMGLFDGITNALNNALSNEDLGTPPPDGLSQDEWLGGMRKTITIEFYKDGELVGKSENLPGDKIKDAATKAKVPVGDEVTLEANGASAVMKTEVGRIPAPVRGNSFTNDPDALMDTGLSAPVFTNFASRGEVRVTEVTKDVFKVNV